MSEKKKAEEGFLYNANYNAALLDERAWCKDQCHLCNAAASKRYGKALSDLSQLIQADGKACIHRTTILV